MNNLNSLNMMEKKKKYILFGSYGVLFFFFLLIVNVLGMLGGRSVEIDGWSGNEIESK